MSEAIAFDTHRFVKNLTASGFTEAQAEALADEQVHLMNSNLATRADMGSVKADIGALKADMDAVKADIGVLKADMDAVKADIVVLKADMDTVKADIGAVRADIQKVKADLSMWMVGALTAQTALITGVVAGLIRLS